MSIWKIAWRSIQQRALSSFLTALSMALGVALIVAVLVIHGVVSQSFERNAQGYDMIVTAKGGKLQAVLNTVFHLSTPIENLPYPYYEEFLDTPEKTGQYAKYVSVAIPYCLGDNYQGFRVVGTTPEMFEKFEYVQGKRYEFSSGQNFAQNDFYGAVIGSLVARQTGLMVGEEFAPTHGVTTDKEQGHKHDPFIVRGVLAPTGTPNDRALFINMEGFYLLEGHAKDAPADAVPEPDHADDEDHPHGDVLAPTKDEAAEAGHDRDAAEEAGHDHTDEPTDGDHDHDAREHAAHDHAVHEHGHEHKPLPKNQREVTAILIRTRNPIAGLTLPRLINKAPFAQAVMPQREIATLFEGVVGNVQKLLVALAGLVVVVAGIGIMVSMYNSMSDRRREIGIMRALGAPRATIVRVILVESLLLAVGGGLAGFVLAHLLIGALDPWIVAQTGVQIGMFQFARPIDISGWLEGLGVSGPVNIPTELLLIGGLALLAQLVGILPAVAAYRTDVSRALANAP